LGLENIIEIKNRSIEGLQAMLVEKYEEVKSLYKSLLESTLGKETLL